MTPSLIDQAAKHAATELERGADWCSAPVGTAQAAKHAATELEHCDHAIEKWQKEVGALQAEEQRRAAPAAKTAA